MYVGYMGGIAFTVSEQFLRTPMNYQRSSSSRWAEHDLILQKPSSQYTGPGLEKISFEMILSAAHGLDPADDMDKLRKMMDNGEVFSLVVGGAPIGTNWYIAELGEGETFFDASGRMIQAKANVTLNEYA